MKWIHKIYLPVSPISQHTRLNDLRAQLLLKHWKRKLLNFDSIKRISHISDIYCVDSFNSNVIMQRLYRLLHTTFAATILSIHPNVQKSLKEREDNLKSTVNFNQSKLLVKFYQKRIFFHRLDALFRHSRCAQFFSISMVAIRRRNSFITFSSVWEYEHIFGFYEL